MSKNILNTVLYICLPILNEYENLPKLLASFKNQTYQNFIIIACVNQPEAWWDNKDKLYACLDNQKSIDLLKKNKDFRIILIDKSSKGNAWIGKKKGVGWARKVAMDRAAEIATDIDIIVSVDADTYYPSNYFESLIRIFKSDKRFSAHSNPYYHPLTGQEKEDLAILRYELYMRVYAINMILIDNPYAFSALGSAMACTVANYKKIGGMSPKASGEDFYFLQHLRKMDKLHQFNEVKVYPQARFSDRVSFGTGPAMIKGDSGDWSSYPFYRPQLFQFIKSTFDSFPFIFDKDKELPMSSFLILPLKRENIWAPLRKNFKKKEKFVRACEEMVDGLRILQFLKSEHAQYSNGDEKDLHENLSYFSKQDNEFESFYHSLKNETNILCLENMKILRDELTKLEYKYRQKQSLA